MGIPKYHGKYICKCASRFCTNSLNISKNNNKIKFYISNSRHENNMHLIIEPEKIPQILKEDGIEEIIPKEKHHDDNIESQLKKIQAKLDSLGTNNF